MKKPAAQHVDTWPSPCHGGRERPRARRSRHLRTRSRPLRSAGKNIPAHAALFDLLTFLKQRTDYAEASLGEIREGTGIDLNVHASLLDILRENIKVEPVEEPGVPLRLRYLPAHGARWLTF
tara:strand:+ start:312 stop:677 length:366 start_codon:yes stop_codon:yes gene_type:complete